MSIPKKNIDWKDIGCSLSKATSIALKKLNFKQATPIQAHAIPVFMSKRDIVAEGVTGSGKTLSFIIPIMEILNKSDNIKGDNIFSVILTPTTELAQQTFEMMCDFLSHFKARQPVVEIYREPGKNKQKPNENLQNIKVKRSKKIKNEILSNKTENQKTVGKVIISTPGCFAKFIDSVDQANDFVRKLKSTEILVMDEADRLLERFSVEIATILKILPKQRITGLFSATQTTDTKTLIRTGLRQAVRVSVKVESKDNNEINSVIPENLSNYYITLEDEQKLGFLVQFIKNHKDQKILVFFAACACVDYFYRVLKEITPNSPMVALHKKVKSRRKEIFKQFKEMKKGVMLSTDIMARGVDVPNIDWVIQFDPPKEASNFVHRCGRTARGTSSGETLLMLRPHEDAYIHFLQKNQQVKLDEYENDDCNVKELPNYRVKMQKICRNDRLMYEKSIKAFVSFIKFYHNHESRYMFPLKSLNVGLLANSYGLLRFPHLAEFRMLNVSDFVKPEVDLHALQYKDKGIRKNKAILKAKRQECKEQNDAMEVDEEPINTNEGDIKKPLTKSQKSKLKKEQVEKKMKESEKKSAKAAKKQSKTLGAVAEANESEVVKNKFIPKTFLKYLSEGKANKAPATDKLEKMTEGKGMLSFLNK